MPTGAYDVTQVKALAKALRDRAFRDSVGRDGLAKAMSARGIRSAGIPREVHTKLAGLSREELEGFAKMQGPLERSGLSDRLIAQMV